MSDSKKILVVGGGTAGWMSAALLAKHLPDRFSVSLVESSAIGPIGVGEGSTPALKAFFDSLGIAESEWMPACNATYKLGISFDGWSTREGFETYFHPFWTHFDRDHVKALIHNALLRRQKKRVHAHPDVFSYAAYLADRKRSPKPAYAFPFEVQYGYHFDASLLGSFLKEKSSDLGVSWHDARISEVRQDSESSIEAVVAEDGTVFEADFFIDCTGFASLLIGDALESPFKSYREILFNDSAVTLLTPAEDEPSCHTRSTALDHGWAWRIPLRSRVGHGYVYSSKYCSAEDAERELRKQIGPESEGLEARHLKMRVGRRENHWVKNCLAVGLSQGFIEPLEATALALTQLTVTRFLHYFRKGGFTSKYSKALDSEMNFYFDNVRDYIAVHYLTNSREDSEYWIDNRTNKSALSDNLKQVFGTWFGCGDLTEQLAELGIDRCYASHSWHYILCGNGVFPPDAQLESAGEEMTRRVPIDSIRDFFERCTLNHKSHKEGLDALLEEEVVAVEARDIEAIGLGISPGNTLV